MPADLSFLDPRIIDPDEEIVERAHLEASDIDQIVQVMESMRRWREVERRMSEASRRYMKLGETDMRALRFLIVAGRHGEAVTPSRIAQHLDISTASTTKLLDRLEAGGHIHRRPHPSDRRRLTIEVTEETRIAARATVGRDHARRFDAIAALTAGERKAVVRFFDLLIASSAPRAEGDRSRPGRPEGEDTA
jgi:DNA-binding MarR family transcriptional regulator